MAPNIVRANRRFAEPSTPTATTFSTNSSSHESETEGDDRARHGFIDYDEGDILDDLLQETLTATEAPRLSSLETFRNLPPSSTIDDGASTCSSTTVAEDEDFDRDGADHGDSASITSMSTSGSSIALPQNHAASVTRTGNGRRRRRRNRGGASVAASDAGSESPIPAENSKLNHGKPLHKAGEEKNKGRQPKQQASATAASTLPEKTAAAGHAPYSKQPPKGTKNPAKSAKPATPARSTKQAKPKYSKSPAVAAARRSRHPRLQIGLDLDVELQLKSKVRGDICLTLVLEETHNVAPRASPEIRRNAVGHYVAYDEWEDVGEEHNGKKAEKGTDDGGEKIEITRVPAEAGARPGAAGTQRREICHLRVGRLNLTRRWWMNGYEMISRFPPPVVAGVAMTMPVAGFAVGWAAAQWVGIWA